jgi:hypothetical protein
VPRGRCLPTGEAPAPVVLPLPAVCVCAEVSFVDAVVLPGVGALDEAVAFAVVGPLDEFVDPMPPTAPQGPLR